LYFLSLKFRVNKMECCS